MVVTNPPPSMSRVLGEAGSLPSNPSRLADLLPATSFNCSACSARFASQKALSQHCRIMHKVVSVMPNIVGSICVCQVCCTNFHTRTRLIAHLSDTRIRSKVRGTNCRAVFLADPSMHAVRSDSDHAIHKEAIREAFRRGHTHQIAVRPASKGKPSVLKGTRAGCGLAPVVRRRITCKTSAPSAIVLPVVSVVDLAESQLVPLVLLQ